MMFQGKTVLVTGGSGRIGSAVVRRLYAEGLSVAWTFHTNQAASDALSALGPKERLMGIQTSQNDLEEARAVVRQVVAAWGKVDYLVNSIGSLCDRTFVRMEESEWQSVLRTNLDMPFVYCKAVIFDQLKAQMGAIVNLSSIAGLAGSAGQANYAAAKAGVLGLTKSLAREAGRFGVRVNAVAPGYIESEMTAQMPEKYRTMALGMIPMGRFGSGEEVAGAVAFLLSDEARYINGQVLVVDGGMVTH